MNAEGAGAAGPLAALALPTGKAAAAGGLAAGLAGAAIGAGALPAWAALPLALALAWAVMVDIDRLRLPDLLTLPMIAGGLAYAAALAPQRLPACLIGASAGYLALVGVAAAFRRWRGRDGLGRGDAKLLAAAGAWTGWAGLPALLFVAAGAGLAFALLRALARPGSASEPLAFGPFLAAGFWMVLLMDGRPLLFMPTG